MIYQTCNGLETRFARAPTKEIARRIFARSLQSFVSLSDVRKFALDYETAKVPSPNYTAHGVTLSPCIDTDQGNAIREYYSRVSAAELRAMQKGGSNHARNMYKPRTAREVAREQRVFIQSASISFE